MTDPDEPKPRRINLWCTDRTCGAPDCRTCHPENFLGGVYQEEEE